jgi:hypothetical protein
MDFDAANKALGNVLKRTAPAPHGSDSCDYIPVTGRPGLALMFVGAVLKRVDAFGPDTRTASGVAIGDPVSKVHKLYPGIQVTPNKYEYTEQYLTSVSGGLAIRFETRDGAVARFHAGALPEVQYTEKCL